MPAHPFARTLLGLALTFAAIATATAGDIGPGSPAPKLQVKKWLKGNPVKELAANKTYVVEFWATWCGPCIDSIPHVTELAKKNPDVTFIGVGIWEDEDGDKIPKFVQNMGEKMDYNVAYSGNKDGMAATWMDAAAQNGIPAAFIVKDQKIVWIGHPMSLDKPLAEVKAGTFDLDTFKKSFEKKAVETRKRMALYEEFNDAMKLYESGKKGEAKKALDKVATKDPEYAEAAKQARYSWLADEDPAAWNEKTRAMLATGNPDEMKKVARFALQRSEVPAQADKARNAIAMVLKANTNNNYTLLVYARTIYLKLGDNKEALDVTTKMIELLPTTPSKDDLDVKESLLKSKAELEAKLQKKSG